MNGAGELTVGLSGAFCPKPVEVVCPNPNEGLGFSSALASFAKGFTVDVPKLNGGAGVAGL